MKRLFVFFVVLLLVFVVVGCSDEGKVETTTEMGKPADAGTTAAEAVAEGTMAGAVEDTAESSFNTMRDIMAKNVPMRCTWEFSDAGNTYSGETLVKGEKFRAETHAQGMTFNSLSDGTWMYTWDTMQPMGSKIRLEDMKKMGEGQEQGSTQPGSFSAESLDASYNYKCSPATISDSEFRPPSDVQFRDLGEFIKLSEQMNQKVEAGEEIDMDELQKQLAAMQQ